MNKILLLGTDGCHLCEDAYSLLAQAGLLSDVVYVDIIDNSDYLNRYQDKIPVLLNCDSGDFIGWPFDVEQIRLFFASADVQH